MKQKFIDYFMKVAEETAKLSSAEKKKVGAVLVRDNRILMTGYNGTPDGYWTNKCELGYTDPDFGGIVLVTIPEVLHAEQNILARMARSTESSEGATLFCTLQPCHDCAKMLFQAGVKTVYYKETYHRDTSTDMHTSVEFMKNLGMKVEKLECN